MKTLIEKNGKLFVQDEWINDYSKPERYRHNWPTEVRVTLYPELVGVELRDCGDGLYVTPDGIKVALTHRGRTKSAWQDTEPIPQPTRRKRKGQTGWEYRYGNWEPVW